MDEIFLKHHQVGLRIVGAWPSHPLLPVYYFGMGISIFFMIFAVWDIVEIFHDFEMLMGNLINSIGCIMALIKLTIFYLKRKRIMMIVNTISNDHLWNYKNEKTRSEIMVQNNIRSQQISKLIIIMFNTLQLTYCLKTLVSYIFDDVQNRKFLAEVTFPMDGRQSPFYELIFIGEIITSSISFNAIALVDSMLVTLVFHASSKIDIVQNEILALSTVYSTNINNRIFILMALKQLIRKHLKCIKFSQTIQEVYSTISFLHISVLTFSQVASGYTILDILERGSNPAVLFNYVCLSISFIFSIGYYCAAGEYLTTKSEIIFNELYNCIWYNFSNQDKKVINFMLAKAREPVRLTMGGFNNLSLIFLTSIMKTSFSYLSVIRAARFK